MALKKKKKIITPVRQKASKVKTSKKVLTKPSKVVLKNKVKKSTKKKPLVKKKRGRPSLVKVSAKQVIKKKSAKNKPVKRKRKVKISLTKVSTRTRKYRKSKRIRLSSTRGPKKQAEFSTDKVKLYKLRGVQDFFREKIKSFDFITKQMIILSKIYGFERIMLPVIEKSSLFKKTTGVSTDIVQKQMYDFKDKSGNHIVLRPEFTPGVARAYIQNGMFNVSQPVKLFYLGPLFRYERPQAGRFRQFNQFGLEMIGTDNPIADAQLILFSQDLFNRLNIKANIQINSLGCNDCRGDYKEELLEYIKLKKNSICSDCKTRATKNPLRFLDCKNSICKELIINAPQLIDNLCDLCKDHFVSTLEYLDEANVAYILNPYLVRGLDYYTRTVWEIWPDHTEINIEDDKKVSTSALGGGGRYDNLIKSLGGRTTPAVGMAYGIERIMSEIKVQKVKIIPDQSPKIFLAKVGKIASAKALKLFSELIKQRIRVSENFAKTSLKAQMERANKLKVKLTLIIGHEEVLNNTIIIRDMNTGSQEIVSQDKLVNELKKRLK
ncbi:histidine--tRNA ligase [Patescibacteria group bacterium]|nr:histidine--tRNA ligase [Patescibacteria group bacterium]